MRISLKKTAESKFYIWFGGFLYIFAVEKNALEH